MAEMAFPGSEVKLDFEHDHGCPTSIEMGWDGEDLVVWITMESRASEDSEADFGFGGFRLKGAAVKARANFSVSEAQAVEWRDALTRLIGEGRADG